MMNVRAMPGPWAGLLAILCATGVACAGGETPTTSPELADRVAAAYAGGTEAAGVSDGGAGGAPSGEGGRSDEGGASSTGGEATGGAATGGAATGGSGGELTAAGGRAGASGASGAAGAPSSCDGFAILAASCGTSGCHGEGSNLEEFAASEAAARAFIDRPGTLACVGQGNVIDTEDPAASLMLKKLSDDPPCGQRMPLTGNPLTGAEVDCIEDWIRGL